MASSAAPAAVAGLAGELRPCAGALKRHGLPDEHACRCANDAVDATLRELHEVRQRLTDEIRASDDTEAARVDKLLAGGDARPGRQPD